MEKKTTEKKIIVGLPAYNEERTIASIVLRVAEYADEVIVVNDGSTDKTEKLAKLAGAEVISHKTNKGYGSAIKRYFRKRENGMPISWSSSMPTPRITRMKSRNSLKRFKKEPTW
jgi:cellulose synthase/poly-beta-1,6-N-acetylglucosamine synthase-like glycosyltransferase